MREVSTKIPLSDRLELLLDELVRIAKPGGYVVVIVRAVDREQWTNASLPATVRSGFQTLADQRTI